MKKTLKLIRRLQLTTSVVIFLLVFFICYKVTGFDITKIPLSKWGVTEKVHWIWNGNLLLLSISCFFNIYHYLRLHPHLQFKRQFTLAFFIQCLNIAILAIVVSGNLIHSIIAYIYFFAMPLVIFLLAATNRYRMKISEWTTHTIISAAMMTIPLACFFLFEGKAMAELTHSLFFIIWNVYLLKENTDII